jgi:hypothetical protein
LVVVVDFFCHWRRIGPNMTWLYPRVPPWLSGLQGRLERIGVFCNAGTEEKLMRYLFPQAIVTNARLTAARPLWRTFDFHHVANCHAKLWQHYVAAVHQPRTTVVEPPQLHLPFGRWMPPLGGEHHVPIQPYLFCQSPPSGVADQGSRSLKWSTELIDDVFSTSGAQLSKHHTDQPSSMLWRADLFEKPALAAQVGMVGTHVQDERRVHGVRVSAFACGRDPDRPVTCLIYPNYAVSSEERLHRHYQFHSGDIRSPIEGYVRTPQRALTIGSLKRLTTVTHNDSVDYSGADAIATACIGFARPQYEPPQQRDQPAQSPQRSRGERKRRRDGGSHAECDFLGASLDLEELPPYGNTAM